MNAYWAKDISGGFIHLCDDVSGMVQEHRLTTVADNQTSALIEIYYGDSEYGKIAEEMITHIGPMKKGEPLIKLLCKVTGDGIVINYETEQDSFSRRYPRCGKTVQVLSTVTHPASANDGYIPVSDVTVFSLKKIIFAAVLGVSVFIMLLTIFFAKDRNSSIKEVSPKTSPKTISSKPVFPESASSPDTIVPAKKSYDETVSDNKIAVQTNLSSSPAGSGLAAVRAEIAAVVEEEKSKKQITGTAVRADTTQTAVSTNRSYLIQDGDTLRRVSLRYFRDEYHVWHIAKKNNITNPDVIEPGIKIEVPE